MHFQLAEIHIPDGEQVDVVGLSVAEIENGESRPAGKEEVRPDETRRKELFARVS
jgi:hypothetical protein